MYLVNDMHKEENSQEQFMSEYTRQDVFDMSFISTSVRHLSRNARVGLLCLGRKEPVISQGSTNSGKKRPSVAVWPGSITKAPLTAKSFSPKSEDTAPQ